MSTVPTLHLSHGQVAWAICDGQPADAKTLDQLRYLRQLGVPFAASKLGVGRGNRLTYHYDELIESGVAIWALRRGVRPRQVADFLIAQRTTLRKIYRQTLRDQADGAIGAPWVRSRGKVIPTLDADNFVALYKESNRPGTTIETMTLTEAVEFNAALGDMVARNGHDVQPLVPLGRLVIQLVTWALEAPDIKAGPRMT